MSQLDLFNARPRIATGKRSAKRPSIDDRFEAFADANPRVFQILLSLARHRLEQGDKYISIKGLWESVRVSLLETHGADSHKLNNDFTASYARALIAAEPRLEGVLRLRKRKGEP